MAIEINRLSLKADGVFRTITHNRIPQIKNKTSTKKEKKIFKKCYIIFQISNFKTNN